MIEKRLFRHSDGLDKVTKEVYVVTSLIARAWPFIIAAMETTQNMRRSMPDTATTRTLNLLPPLY